MDEDKLRNQIPILGFLYKHKWSIIVPLLISVYYLGFPYSFNVPPTPSVYSQLSIKPAQDDSLKSINQQVANVLYGINSDESLLALVAKYDLFSQDRKNGISDQDLLEKVRWRISVEQQLNSPEDEAVVFVSARFLGEDFQKNDAVTKEIESRFEKISDFNVSKPKLMMDFRPPWKLRLTILMIYWFFFASILILIWETPRLFYSRKTQELIFDPIRSDWEREAAEARSMGDIVKILRIHLQYSFAFVAAMLQRTPIGDLVESVGKLAK